MSGQPAARLGDAVKGSKIIQGSRTVLIGSQGGVACSECPGGVAKGSPVSVSLGAKVLWGTIDLDFALPGVMPLAWQRQYSSYVNAEHGGACGVFGYGWKSPLELQLLLVDAQAQLFDTSGRVITFEDRLLPGTSLYSPSEDIWLLRGGMLGQPVPAFKPRAASSPSITPPSRSPTASTPQAHDEPVSFVHYIEASDAAHWGAHQRWQHIPAEWVDNPHCIIATSGNGQVLWCFEPKTTAHPLVAAQRWLLTGKRDALGRQQRLHYAAHLPEGQRRLLDAQGHSSDMALPAHMLVAIEDGVGRHYQLHYHCSNAAAATAWQQRQQARERALANDQPPPEWDCSTGHRGQAGWQMDSGIRLSCITLEHSPQVDSPLATQPIALVRYTYSAEGDLSAVYNRSGALVRQFQYANHLMVAHRHRQGPWHRYVYESESEDASANHSPALPGARVRIHTNEQGLSWQFDYQHDRLDPKRTSTLVTDSLGRQERYDYHGLGGLKRLARHTRADGTSIAHTYNGFGHLGSTTNALGHTSYIRRDGQGRVMGTQSAQGLNTQVRYNPLGQLSHTEDAQGIRTDYSYDRYGRLVLTTTTARGMGREQEPLTQRYHYPDPTQEPLIAHLPTTITDARGGNKHLRYNSAGQQTRYSDCSGQSTYWSWDAWGQLSSTSDAQGHSQQHHYDAAGQLLGTELANGQRICNQWSEAGLLTRSWLQDSQGQAIADSVVQLHYDLWGRLTHREQGASSLHMRYDSAGRLIELINENGASSYFDWDVMDRQTQEQGFDGRIQRYQYDAAGQLSAHRDGHAQSPKEHWLYSQYRWSADGQLLQAISSQHSAEGTVQRLQELHYSTGLLSRACSYLQQPGDANPWLQSETLLERDPYGRTSGEIQRLWAQPDSEAPSEPPHHKLAKIKTHPSTNTTSATNTTRWATAYAAGTHSCPPSNTCSTAQATCTAST